MLLICSFACLCCNNWLMYMQLLLYVCVSWDVSCKSKFFIFKHHRMSFYELLSESWPPLFPILSLQLLFTHFMNLLEVHNSRSQAAIYNPNSELHSLHFISFPCVSKFLADFCLEFFVRFFFFFRFFRTFPKVYCWSFKQAWKKKKGELLHIGSIAIFCSLGHFLLETNNIYITIGGLVYPAAFWWEWLQWRKHCSRPALHATSAVHWIPALPIKFAFNLMD